MIIFEGKFWFHYFLNLFIFLCKPYHKNANFLVKVSIWIFQLPISFQQDYRPKTSLHHSLAVKREITTGRPVLVLSKRQQIYCFDFNLRNMSIWDLRVSLETRACLHRNTYTYHYVQPLWVCLDVKTYMRIFVCELTYISQMHMFLKPKSKHKICWHLLKSL